MFVVVLSKSAWHAVGEQIASLLTFINRTYSETGQVKLAHEENHPDHRVDGEVKLMSKQPEANSPVQGASPIRTKAAAAAGIR